MNNDNLREFKVLHIEDSDTDAYAVERALSKSLNESYKLQRVSCVGDAEELLKTDEVWDIILLDLELPDSNGRTETFQRISKAKRDNIPVLILTSVSDHGLAVGLVDEGAEDYVKKSTISPSPETLQDAIAFAISRHKNFTSVQTRKDAALKEKEQIIDWMSGGYSIQAGSDKS